MRSPAFLSAVFNIRQLGTASGCLRVFPGAQLRHDELEEDGHGGDLSQRAHAVGGVHAQEVGDDAAAYEGEEYAAGHADGFDKHIPVDELLKAEQA